MEKLNTAILINLWLDKVPRESVAALQQSLDEIKDDNVSVLSFITLKNPIIGLLLGLFGGTFGVDRFYKGDIGLGITKFSILIISFELAIFTSGAGLFGWFILYVWIFIDLFLVWRGIKTDNFNKIMQNLQYVK